MTIRLSISEDKRKIAKIAKRGAERERKKEGRRKRDGGEGGERDNYHVRGGSMLGGGGRKLPGGIS
jgi:hypothetical protein